KATMDFESYQEGTILYIGPKEGEAVPVDAVIAVLGDEGEDYQALLDGAGGQDKNDQDKNEKSEKKEAAAEQDTAESATAKESSDEGGDEGVTAESLGATVITMPLLSDTMTEGV